MQQTSGRGQRQHMLSYYARWRGGRCNGKIQTGCTGSGEHMPKNTFLQVNQIGHVLTKNHGFIKIVKPQKDTYLQQAREVRTQKDHEVNGRLHRHTCAFSLTTGKQLNHSEKNCLAKSNQAKNNTTAAHH